MVMKHKGRLGFTIFEEFLRFSKEKLRKRRIINRVEFSRNAEGMRQKVCDAEEEEYELKVTNLQQQNTLIEPSNSLKFFKFQINSL